MKLGSLQIVGSCTNRKRIPVPNDLCLRAVHASPTGRFSAWWSHLLSHCSPTVPALNLYAGDHWTVVRDLPRAASASALHARLWVASAGYGLVPADAPLHAYAATFTPGQADSVTDQGRGGEQARAWWSRLAAEAGPAPGTPRSIAQLVRASPRGSYLIVASPPYVSAMEDDLVDAARALDHPRDLMIISGEPGPRREELRELWIPSVAALQGQVGGALTSLHARVARRIIEDAPRVELTARAMREHLAALARQVTPPPRPSREATDDDDVRTFIARSLRTDPAATHTHLLRVFRDSGRACEQGRFRRLFQQVKVR